MSIYEEKQPKLRFILFILTVCFVCSFSFWRLGAEQLTSNEGQYAVAVSELHQVQTYVTLHGQASYDIMPLYPLMAKGICKCGASMEFALRFLSFLSLALISLMTGLICGKTYDRQAGLVAALIVFSSYLTLFHAVDGLPHTTIAFFLYSGWILWFYLGYMRSSWNFAWIAVGFASVIIFFLGGKFALCCFLFPLAFLHRPFKPWTHIKSRGFLCALAMIVIGMLLWRIPVQNAVAGNSIDAAGEIRIPSILSHIFLFPFEVLLELFPWSFMIWLPFCPLLFSIEEKPLFMKYHRILFVVLALLLWLHPGTESRDVVYIIPLFAILIASDYRIFVRRYSAQCFHTAILCAAASIIWTGLLFLQLRFPTQSLVTTFITPISRIIWHFKPDGAATLKITYLFAGLLSMLLAVLVIYLARKRTMPWLLWSILFVSFAIPYHEIVIPEKASVCEKRNLGNEIRTAIDKQSADAPCLYKDSAIGGLYAECYYIGLPVTVTGQGKLPENAPETVFMLTAGTPSLYTEKSWTLLLSENYRGKSLYLYMGKPFPKEEFNKS